MCSLTLGPSFLNPLYPTLSCFSFNRPSPRNRLVSQYLPALCSLYPVLPSPEPLSHPFCLWITQLKLWISVDTGGESLDNFPLKISLSPSYSAIYKKLFPSQALSSHSFSTPLVLHKNAVERKTALRPNIRYLHLATPPYMGKCSTIIIFLHILTPSTTSTIIK